MNKRLTVLLAVWLPVAMVAADPKPKPPAAVRPVKTPQQKPAFQQQANRTQAQAANQEARAAQQALNAPNVARLAQMSPEERAAALAQLPPARRQQLEQRLEKFSQLPPGQQARILSQYNRMQALPPERREQVRLSLEEYNSIQPPRKGVIGAELTRLSTMTDEQRASYMNRPGFRARFSEPEIRLMNDLRGIVP